MTEQALQHWANLATIVSGIAALAYAVLTTALVWVARRQSSIAEAQTAVAQRQNRLLALQLEFQARQAVAAATQELAAASLALGDLISRTMDLRDRIKPGALTQGDPRVHGLSDNLNAFVSIHFPVLRSKFGEGHDSLVGLLLMHALCTEARATAQWPTHERFQRVYADPVAVLQRVLDETLTEQMNQTTLLASAVSVTTADTQNAV